MGGLGLKINKPDETEIRVEHHGLYQGMSQKLIAACGYVSSTVLSRRLDQNETIVKNPPYELIMEIIASVESEQPSIGKGLVGMILRYAVALGLIDEEPVDRLKLAIDRLRAIRKEDIEMMTEDQRTLTELYAGELREAAGRVYEDAQSIRIANEARPRSADLNGDRELGGRARGETVGSRN